MTDIVWPPGLLPSEMTWSLVRNQQRSRNPYSGTMQRNDRGGDLWSCRLQMPTLAEPDSGLLAAWMDQISRAGNAGLVPVFQNFSRGQSAAAAFAQLQAPWFERDASLDWTGQTLLATVYLRNRDLTLYASGSASAGTEARLSRSFTVAQGLPYLVTFDIPVQTQPGGYRITDGSTTLVDQRAAPPGAGRFMHLVYPGTTTLQVFLYAETGQQAFASSRFTAVSVQRAFIAQTTANAGGTLVNLFGAASAAVPSLTHGVGQFISVQTSAGWELKRLISDIDMISSSTINGVSVLHQGRALVEPALRGTVSANAGTVHRDPVCRMILNEAVSAASVQAPLRSGFVFELIEDPT